MYRVRARQNAKDATVGIRLAGAVWFTLHGSGSMSKGPKSLERRLMPP